MALHHAASGEIIDLALSGDALSETVSTALFKTEEIEVIRMVLRAGREVPEHSVPGEMTLQCLEGAVELSLHDGVRILRAGQLVCLQGNAPHAVRAIDNASLLLTIVLKHAGANQGVQ
jgi:quercetin dioxygenase-like cupin family protein